LLTFPADRTVYVRRSLAEAVLAERPRVVACAAPAGYGKSTLEAELVRAFPSALRCGPGTGDTIGFGRALIDALCDEDPSRQAALAATLLRLPPDPDTWSAAVLAAWRETEKPAAVTVFERVDALDVGAAQLLRQLIADRANRELIVLCSRRSLASIIPRETAPSDVIMLTERDFRLSLSETAAFFGDQLDTATVARVDCIAHGWPLALEVLRRGHRRGHLERLLEDRHDVEYHALDSYIETEIIGMLSEAEIDSLCALSVLGETSPQELRDSFPLWLAGSVERVRLLPFIRSERDRIALSPILSASLERTYRERRIRIARGIADALLQRRADWIRATSIVLDVGDADTASEIFQNARAPIAGSSPDAAALVARFEHDTLVKHPALWLSTAMYRLLDITVDEWLHEATVVWGEHARGAPGKTRIGIAAAIVLAQMMRGDWGAVEAVRSLIAAEFGNANEDPPPPLVMVQALIDAAVRAARMQRVDLTALMRDIAPLLAADSAYALVLCVIIARVHIARSDRDAQRQALDEAVLRARLGGIAPVLAICLQEAATMAWIAGEDLLFEMYTEELEHLVEAAPALKRGAMHFLNCARGRGISARAGTERPAARALAWLVAAGITNIPGERRTLLDRALRTADGCRAPHPMILARLAIAAALPAAAQRWTEAEEIAASINPTFWQGILAQHSDSGRGKSLASRFATEEPRDSKVMVRILEGTVESDGKKVAISPKEFQLFALLAMSAAAIDAETLSDALWPGRPLDRGAASLRVYVSRARRKIGNRACIEIDRGRYRAPSFVTTDLDEINTSIRRVPARPTHAEITGALRSWFALIAGPPAFLLDLPAFSSLNADVNDLIDRMEAWLTAVRERCHESDRARITMALEAAANA